MTHIATIPKNAREDLRVTLDEFRGHQLTNLRIWLEVGRTELRPAKQDVPHSPNLLRALLDAEQKACISRLLNHREAL